MENKNPTAVVELINNIQFIAAAYNQIWTIKIFDTNCGKKTIAFIDERSGEEKLVFYNPDVLMSALITEIRENGWMNVKEKYLNSTEFSNSRLHLCEKECDCQCHH